MSLQQEHIMPFGLVLLSPISLLFKHAYWLSAAARLMLAGLWPLNQHTCWHFVTQYCLSAGGVLLFCYTCWYGVSLSAALAGMVSHYQLCLLVWYLSAMHVGVVPHYRPCLLGRCLTVGHVFWCGASLYAMPVGMVPHYRQCLLACFALQPTFLLVEFRGKRNGYKSGATLKEVPLHQTWLLIQCHSQIFLLVQCNSIRNACWVHLFRYVLLHQARNLVWYISTRHAYR